MHITYFHMLLKLKMDNPHLVCHRFLMYEFMANGSLKDHLHGKLSDKYSTHIYVVDLNGVVH